MKTTEQEKTSSCAEPKIIVVSVCTTVPKTEQGGVGLREGEIMPRCKQDSTNHQQWHLGSGASQLQLGQEWLKHD
jgi:hypothetical protein